MTGREESRFEGLSEPLEVTAIGDAMTSLLRARGLGATAVLARISEVWDAAVGAELAARIRPVALRGRELVCEVPEPAWATQLRLVSDRLLARLEEELGARLVDDLSVRVRPRSGR